MPILEKVHYINEKIFGWLPQNIGYYQKKVCVWGGGDKVILKRDQ